MTSAPIVRLLVDLLRVGIRIESHDGKLHVTPPEALTTDLRQRIKRDRDELLRLFENTAFLTGGTDKGDRSSAVPSALSVRSGNSNADSATANGIPATGCPNCRRCDFVLIEPEPTWRCAHCDPPPTGAVIVATWTERSKPLRTAELFDMREVDDVA